jgi:TolB-like protein
LLEELKRRRLIAVVTWYVLAAWVALQVADVLGPVLTGGDQALRFVVYLAVVGFPIALFLGWRYDVRGGRIQQTAPAEGAEQTPLGLRDYLLLGLAGIALVAIVTWSLRQAGQAPIMETVGAPNSVAVLKFADQTHASTALANELSDQLVTSLIANANLIVSGRESSFYFADHPADLDRISRMLQSRHLLTGVLRGESARPLLRLELLAMPGERRLYAEEFQVDPDRPWKLYTAVAERVALAVGVNPVSRIDAPLDDTVANYLRLADLSDTALEALEWAKKAVNAAPDHALALSAVGMYHQLAMTNNSIPVSEAMAGTREALDRARESGADDYYYHWAEGLYLRRVMRFQGVTPEREQAFISHMDRAIALNPSDATLFVTYSIHHRLQRRYDVAGDLLRRGLLRDPLNPGVRLQYSRILSAQGDSDKALEWALQLPALFDFAWEDVASRYFERGELDRGAWWQWRWPGKNDHLNWAMATTWMELQAPEEARALLNDIAPDSHIRPMADVYLALIEARDEDALALALSHIDAGTPDQRQAMELMRAAGAAQWVGDPVLTVELVERAQPALVDALAPEVDDRNAEAAQLLATALRQLGGQEVREGVLASAILATTRNRSVTGFDGIGDRAVRVQAYRGETERAVALLQEAYAHGFRKIYNSFGRLPREYEAIADDPDFQAVLDRFDADIDRMRANVRGWIRDGVDFVGSPPEELAKP